MTSIKRLQFTTSIAAPVEKVFALMTNLECYKKWTSAFAEGCFFEGSWEQGQRIRFLSKSGDGMLAEIAECRPNQFISIRHLGFIANGKEDTESESIRAWAPAYENYTFHATASGTKLVVDQDVVEEWEAFMSEAWPKALDDLKALCESESAG